MAAPPLHGTASASHKSHQEHSETLLTMHAALVLLIAMLIGAAMAVLTWRTTTSLAAAVAAGLVATGSSTPVLHKLIGR